MNAPRLFWYVSTAKLSALGTQGHNWRDRVRAKLSFKVGPAAAEVGLDSVAGGVNPSALRSVKQAEKQLRRDGFAIEVQRVLDAGGPPYFSWEGPSARAVVRSEIHEHAEAFWAASICDQVGVLLVGSVTHAIGAAAVTAVDLSPSVDPVGAVKRFFEPLQSEDPETADMYNSWAADGWTSVMGSSVGNLASMPRTRGIAQYAGSVELELPLWIRGVNTGTKLRGLVIGSPLWVEQISQTASRPE